MKISAIAPTPSPEDFLSVTRTTNYTIARGSANVYLTNADTNTVTVGGAMGSTLFIEVCRMSAFGLALTMLASDRSCCSNEDKQPQRL